MWSLQVYGDSSVVINWMNGSGILHNIHLRPVGDLLLKLAGSFDHISLPCVQEIEPGGHQAI